MCGIAGYFGTGSLTSTTIDACLAQMLRRGPDQQAWCHWEVAPGQNLYLFHSRLSIIDLDKRSGQPLRSGNTWIAANGELYNYLELRAELTAAGVDFATQSDSEVMAAVLDRFGWQGLDRCEGMWAFAAYHESDKTLMLCRDRFGEKPLYLYRSPDGVYFGSEIKFIAAMLGRRLEIDMDHLKRYLTSGYKSLYKTPRSFFKGVTELEAGTILKLDKVGGESTHRYWTPRCSPKEEMSFEDAVQGTRQKLIRSMEIRLRADVPLAFCMSGGVDSVALISIAKRMFGYDVHGFTIVNTDSRYEESEMVDLAVSKLDLRHTTVPVTTVDFLPRLRELVRYHDAPVYTISYYAHWLLMREIAAGGYRISVSGSAADELFSGYYDHHLAYLHDIRGDQAHHSQALKNWQNHILPIVRNRHLRNSDLFIDNPDFREHLYDEAEELRSFLHKDWRESFTEGHYADDLLRNRMLNELFHESVPVILHEDDLNAMYYSIENRSPYLDRDLFEFCNTIPTRHLIRDGRAKAVLREALRGIAPEAIMENRRKVGFNAPIFDFLDINDAKTRDQLLADSPIFDIVRRERIEELLAQQDLPNSHSKFLFNFICAKMFLEEFGESV